MTSLFHLSRWRVLAVASLVLAALLLNLSAIPATAQNQAKIVVIRVGTGDSGEGLNPHQEIIAAFEKQNPDILVQLEAVAGNDYYARLLTQVAADAAPDLMQIGDDAVPMFVSKGALADLTPFASGKYPLDAGIYLPGLLTPGQYQGKQYMLPKDYSPLAVYYNKKVFDQYKIAYPKDGWTWDDFLQTAQAVTKASNGAVWGVQLPGAWTSGFEYWIAAAGGSLIDKEGKTFVGHMDSEATIKAVQFYADLYNKHKVAPPVADMSAFGGGNSEFENGKAAMRIFGRWPQSGLIKNPKVELATVGMPVGAKRANVLFWGGFGIAKTSKNPEAAWRFLRFYTGAEAAKTWKSWALPTVKSVADSVDAVDKTWINELTFLAPRAYTFTDFWGETADPALSKALQTVILTPAADVKATMTLAAKEAQAALEKAKK